MVAEPTQTASRKRRRPASLEPEAQPTAPISQGEQEDASPFEEVLLSLGVALLPAQISDVYEGLSSNINGLLMRYNPEIEGVVLTLGDIHFKDGQNYGRILNEMPHLHFAIEVKALVFRPQVGMKLTARITQVWAYTGTSLVYRQLDLLVPMIRKCKPCSACAATQSWRCTQQCDIAIC